jgi:hypothetical protein
MRPAASGAPVSVQPHTQLQSAGGTVMNSWMVALSTQYMFNVSVLKVALTMPSMRWASLIACMYRGKLFGWWSERWLKKNWTVPGLRFRLMV